MQKYNLKAFVRPDNTTTIVCPGCKEVKQISVAAYRHTKHSINIRCKCNTRFTVHLDFRNHYRKETDFPGTYRIIKPSGKGSGDIHICNISRGGIGFTVSGLHIMEPGQTLQLEFRLNDKKQTKLIKQARICTVDNNYIGCQFVDQDLMEKALGFYLRP